MSNETRNLVVQKHKEGLNFCQQDQAILYDRYLASSRSQLGYLLEVISSEMGRSSPYHHSAYMNLLQEKIFHYIVIDQMNKNMKRVSLFKLYQSADLLSRPSVMGLESVKIELGDEINKTFNKILDTHSFKELAFSHIEEELLTDTLKDILKGRIKAFMSGAAKKAIMNILAGKVTQETFKKALLSTGIEMSSNILVGVAKSSLISLVTLPLHGYRLSDEDMWLNLTEKAPILLLNPDWKVDDYYGRRAASDWQIHCRTMIWKPERIEVIFNKFVRKTEKNFYSTVENIRSSVDFNNPIKMIQPLPADGTYVRPKFNRKNI